MRIPAVFCAGQEIVFCQRNQSCLIYRDDQGFMTAWLNSGNKNAQIYCFQSKQNIRESGVLFEVERRKLFTCNLEEDPTQSRPALAVFCNTVPQRLFVHFIHRQPRQLNMLMSRLIHSIIFIRRGWPCILKNYRLSQLKIVCLVLL